MTNVPTYQGQPLADMNKQELLDLSFKLDKRLDEIKAKWEDPKFKEKMKGQPPPTINPAYTELQEAIKVELANRS